MRWEALFADLAAEFDAAEVSAYDVEAVEATRAASAQVRLADRLAGAAGETIAIGVRGVGRVDGTLLAAGLEWLLLDDRGSECLVPLPAVTYLDGVPDAAVSQVALGRVTDRLTLGFALRGFVRRRVPVAVALTDGTRLTGTFDRVGADFADLAVHPLDEPRRDAAVVATRALRLRALALVRDR